jgi:hypothetical protein
MERRDQLSDRLTVTNPVEDDDVRSEMADMPSGIENAVHELDGGIGDGAEQLPNALLIVNIRHFRMIVDQDIHLSPLGRTSLREIAGHAQIGLTRDYFIVNQLGRLFPTLTR